MRDRRNSKFRKKENKESQNNYVRLRIVICNLYVLCKKIGKADEMWGFIQFEKLK